MLAPLQRWLAELSISPPPPAKPSLVLEVVNGDDHVVLEVVNIGDHVVLEVVNIHDNVVLEVVLDILRRRGFDDRWLCPGVMVLEVLFGKS